MPLGATIDHPGDRLVRHSWTLAQDETGNAVSWAVHADRSVQVSGTFGGASVSIDGSNDGANYVPLNDAQGNVLTISSAKIEQVLELALLVRPKITGGDGTTSITITLLGRT